MASIYIHIPYCKQQCNYCNFHFRISQKDKTEMINCMKKEITQRADYLDSKELETIYFGGGTPSILSVSEIKELLTTINIHYSINNKTEITLECNPDDISTKKLIALKKNGINRLSIGVQSFHDKDLEFMNRSHNSKEAINCIKIAKKVGFKNITIDLMYGLPNQSLRDWQKSLNIMFKLDIPHFSAYALTIEPKTALYNLVKKKKVKILSDEKTISQFNLLQEKAMKNEFVHYEISNFGKKDFFSTHNIGYWENKHYLGIGPSAHSFNGSSRSWNVSSNKEYISALINKSTYFQTETLSKEQQYNEYIFTSLRTVWGVDLSIIQQKFNKKIASYFICEIEKWCARKYISINKNKYTLTKEGKAFADAIASDLFIV
ncbi:MAG: coproporphyrinogen III oxidase [Flavobacteriales bacterium]|nr:coproporphyrinogen III oxidase [Flavobacteriales bacterium]